MVSESGYALIAVLRAVEISNSRKVHGVYLIQSDTNVQSECCKSVTMSWKKGGVTVAEVRKGNLRL